MSERLTKLRPTVLGGSNPSLGPHIANDIDRREALGALPAANSEALSDAGGGHSSELRVHGISRRSRKADRDFDVLRMRLLAGQSRGALRNDALVIALLSRTSGEGVSTIAAGLSRAFSRNGDGRILLVDADDVSNGLSKSVPATSATVHLNASNLGPDTYPGAIKRWGIDFVALGANGADRFVYGLAWDDYFSMLRGRYDIIVVDAGSLETGTPYHWSNVPSHVILVVDTTKTTIKALERLREELKSSGPTVTGVVLNKRAFPIPTFLY